MEQIVYFQTQNVQRIVYTGIHRSTFLTVHIHTKLNKLLQSVDYFFLFFRNISYSAEQELFNYAHEFSAFLNIVRVFRKSKILNTYFVFFNVSIMATESIIQQQQLTAFHFFIVHAIRKIIVTDKRTSEAEIQLRKWSERNRKICVTNMHSKLCIKTHIERSLTNMATYVCSLYYQIFIHKGILKDTCIRNIVIYSVNKQNIYISNQY